MRTRSILTMASVVAVLAATGAALPAAAASSTSITDPKGDEATTAIDATTGATTSTPAAYPAVDIRKVKAKRTSTKLVVTIKASLLKKSDLDAVSILVRTSHTTSPKYLILVKANTTGTAIVTSKSSLKIVRKSITFHTKPGVDGTVTVTIPDKWFGNAKKVSVAGLLTHIQDEASATTISDVSGTVDATSKQTVHWTPFISAK
jgi:hypothetical protein